MRRPSCRCCAVWPKETTARIWRAARVAAEELPEAVGAMLRRLAVAEAELTEPVRACLALLADRRLDDLE